MRSSRRPREEWRKHVCAWKASGLSSRQYAARSDLNANTLTWWRWRLEKESATARRRRRDKPTLELVELTPVEEIRSKPGVERLELDVAGVVVRLPGDFDTDALTRLLRVLEARR
jgi:hypothetical protein